jgi:hypothetical protein
MSLPMSKVARAAQRPCTRSQMLKFLKRGMIKVGPGIPIRAA